MKSDFDGKDVFEVGSGYGVFAEEYLTDAKSIFGIDTSKETVDHVIENWSGSQKTGQAHFQEGNIVDISLPVKEFDWVIFANSF